MREQMVEFKEKQVVNGSNWSLTEVKTTARNLLAVELHK